MAKLTQATKAETAAPVVNMENAPAPVAPPKPAEPTSPKLDELRAKKLEFKKLARTFEPDSDEENNALMEAYKVQQLIKAEIAAIKTAEATQALEVARNERVKLFDNAIAAYDEYNNNPDVEGIAYANYQAAREIVVNELLAKFSGSRPAVAKSAGSTATGDGATKSDILAAHIANVAAGMDDSASRKALEAAGNKRSTVWHTVNNYNKAK